MAEIPPKPLVLVADDEESVRDLICRILRDVGWDAQAAADGRDALDKMAARRPDLLILDLMMPELDGWGVLDKLRGQDDAPPVLLHRDYHPVNLLWGQARVSGVVDWINACMGPPGVDVAHCRLNLALMYGMAAADAYLAAYQHHAPGYRHDFYWDVDDALSAPLHVLPYVPWSEFGLTELTREILQSRLEAFVQAAVSR